MADRKPTLGRVIFTTPEKARKTAARFTRYFANGDVDERTHAGILSAARVILEYFKFERDGDLTARLEAIEEKLNDSQ